MNTLTWLDFIHWMHVLKQHVTPQKYVKCKIFLCLTNVLIEAFHVYSPQKHVQVTLKHRYVNVFLSRYSGSENKNKEEELYTIFFTNLTNFIASLSAELLSKHQLMFPDH